MPFCPNCLNLQIGIGFKIGTTAMSLINEMNHVVDHCYDMEIQLKELSARVHSIQLKNQFAYAALYYKDLGDHLFLVLAAEGNKLEQLIVTPGELTLHWLDIALIQSVSGDMDILKLVIQGNKKAKANLAKAFDYSEIPADLTMVIRNGILEINGILNTLQSNAMLDPDE